MKFVAGKWAPLLVLALAWAKPAAAGGAFDSWSLQGVSVVANQAQMAPSAAPLSCSADAVDGSSEGFDAATGLCRGRDTSTDGAYYNGGSFVFGTMTSPAVSTPAAFDRLVGSWDAFTPEGTWIELHARLLQAPGWSRWYALPVWASDTGSIKRHSVNGQKDARAEVQTDTLVPAAGFPAGAYQLEMTLFGASPNVSPAVKLVNASTLPGATPAQHLEDGVELTVPPRSQMLRSTGL
jgi:hypothetical protein